MMRYLDSTGVDGVAGDTSHGDEDPKAMDDLASVCVGSL